MRSIPNGAWSLPTRFLLAAGMYWLAGRLALMMAIPPGYATAVWPAAGLALVSVLVWGRHVVPAILLGSFLVNVGTAFDGTTTASVVRSVVIASGIALGAASQAAAGAALVRRVVGFPTLLDVERQIVLFATLGGPLACVVSATFGVTTVCAFGVVPWSNFPFSWWTWWVGDSIGVLIFAPLALLFAHGGHELWRERRMIVGVPLLLGFAAVTVLFLRASAWEESRLRSEFEARALPVTHAISASLADYEEVVGATSSLFYASSEVTRDEFREFTRRPLARYPVLQALAWDPVVTHADRAHFEAAARDAGLTDYEISERDPQGATRRAGDRPEYVAIRYIEPEAGNHIAIGFDVSSDPSRMETLSRARTTGASAATGRVTLVQEPEAGRAGVLLIVPVFVTPDAHTLRGYVAGVFRLKPLVDSAVRGFDTAGLDVRILDESARAPAERVLYAHGSEASNLARAWRWEQSLRFGGRRWSIEVIASDAYMTAHRSWQAWIVLAGGLAFVGLLGVMMLMTTGRAWRIRALNAELEDRVQARTGALSRALREREVLLQEVHHRVKNNLQVITSLINLQARQLEPGGPRDALEECRSRVQAISFIHERLYQTQDYAEVPFADYARSLARTIFQAAGPSGDSNFELDIADVPLPVDVAIPCGLVLNELMTNAFKHAFPNGRRGTVSVSLARIADGRMRLTVADDGVGLPPQFDPHTSSSLGLQIISTLADQLDGELDVASGNGARFSVTFAIRNETRIASAS